MRTVLPVAVLTGGSLLWPSTTAAILVDGPLDDAFRFSSEPEPPGAVSALWPDVTGTPLV